MSLISVVAEFVSIKVISQFNPGQENLEQFNQRTTKPKTIQPTDVGWIVALTKLRAKTLIMRNHPIMVLIEMTSTTSLCYGLNMKVYLRS
ncbi:unnamed protein product [Clavelina lepadiformis]|uniref:Uncharacterized protein n=1 Tax=Clavelina lepadiformis TaxID=159417 RepID=A0ABP0GN68_CLALP